MPEVAEELNAQIPGIKIDYERGIDHAAWAVIKHVFPEQNVPVLEMSLNVYLSNHEHVELGKKLSNLDLGNVLFMGSGNVIHNLYDVDFNDHAAPFKWAVEINEWIKNKIENDNQAELVDAPKCMPNYQKAAPTNEHYLPLLYVLGLRKNKTAIEFNEIQNGSISMLSFSVE